MNTDTFILRDIKSGDYYFYDLPGMDNTHSFLNYMKQKTLELSAEKMLSGKYVSMTFEDIYDTDEKFQVYKNTILDKLEEIFDKLNPDFDEYFDEISDSIAGNKKDFDYDYILSPQFCKGLVFYQFLTKKPINIAVVAILSNFIENYAELNMLIPKDVAEDIGIAGIDKCHNIITTNDLN